MKKITKLFTSKAASIDAENHTVQFVISDTTVDRYGEIVDQKSWDFANYLKNPIVLWGHDPSIASNVLGTASDLTIKGEQTIATFKLDTDINPNALLIWNQIVRGTLRCVSVGFMNHSLEWVDDVPVLKDNELLEISVVPIPANPNAIALSLKEGSITPKDAKWLLESMKHESVMLEDQLKSMKPTNKEQNSMDAAAKEALDGLTLQVTEMGAAIKEGLTALAESNKLTNESITTLAEALKDGKPEPKKPVDGGDGKGGDGKDGKDEPKPKLDADGKPVLDDDGKPVLEDPETDPAKGGEDDQPGAGKDEIDEDAELTPEQEAEAIAALDEIAPLPAE